MHSIPQGERWNLAQPFRERREALIIDGYNSTSLSRYHVIQRYTQEALACPVVAFSYSDLESHYLATDTHPDARATAIKSIEYMPRRGDQVVIPVGISAGAVIAILGVGSWLALVEGVTPRDTVPRIILVAPAISPNPDLLDEFESEGTGAGDSAPVVISQLCGRDDPEWLFLQRALEKAFRRIGQAGIPIHVIHWPFDILTPYPWDGSPNVRDVADPLLNEIPTYPSDMPSVRSTSKRLGARQHLRFCAHDETINQVRTLLP
jgi:hypothetical protein